MNVTRSRSADAVRKALEFMRANHSADMTAPKIAAYAGCSQVQLWRMFKNVTGKSIVGNLQDIRIGHSRQLLCQTSLPISEIAWQSGFESPAAFCRLFRKSVGTTPTLYRQTADAREPAPIASHSARDRAVVLDGDFSAGQIPPWIKPLDGQWRVADGQLHGESLLDLTLRLDHPLPENFTLDFGIRTISHINRPINIALNRAENTASGYCVFNIDTARNGTGGLYVRGRPRLWSRESMLADDKWHSVSLMLNDNRITLTIDGRTACAHRDLFPPPHAERSVFSLRTHGASIALRRMRLTDLGFLPVVPAIRQGDTLFNNGLFDQARVFYLSHLRQELTPEEEMELRFKIGVCLRREGRIAECLNWLHGILPLANDPFWHRQCEATLLELEMEPGHIPAFKQQAKRMFRDPGQRGDILPLVSEFFHKLQRAGFHEDTVSIARLWSRFERTWDRKALRSQARLANVLKNLKQFPAAVKILHCIDRHGQSDYRWDALVSLSDIALLRGDPDEARQYNAKARALSDGRIGDGWCDIQEAVCLRSEHRFRDAIELLIAVSRRPSAQHWHKAALSRAAELLYCLGDRQSAVTMLTRIPPDSKGAACNPLSTLSLLIDRRYQELAARLINPSVLDDGNLSRQAQEAVTAGIALELAGDSRKAVELWEQTKRRFPSGRCYFWGSLAGSFAKGKPDLLEKAKLFWHDRSEMMHLAGLLYEYRGDRTKADRMFTLSLKEDPTLCWPALLSEQRLDRLA